MTWPKFKSGDIVIYTNNNSESWYTIEKLYAGVFADPLCHYYHVKELKGFLPAEHNLKLAEPPEPFEGEVEFRI